MIKKAARTNLTKAMADFAFDEARSMAGAVVEMIEQDNDRWTVTVVWDDSGAPVTPEDLAGFEKAPVSRVGTPPVRLGVLSERFESNGNPGAIGFDTKGGFSYGAYQIATRPGTMKTFLEFLRLEAPQLHAPLQQAGGNEQAMAGAESFKRAWRTLAADPAFKEAQHAFIQATHYEPFVLSVRSRRGIDVATRSSSLQNVAWSVAVQHGRSNKVFENALPATGAAGMDDKAVIDAVYAERSRVDVYFPSSTPQVREALLARFQEEKTRAIAMLA